MCQPGINKFTQLVAIKTAELEYSHNIKWQATFQTIYGFILKNSPIVIICAAAALAAQGYLSKSSKCCEISHDLVTNFKGCF